MIKSFKHYINESVKNDLILYHGTRHDFLQFNTKNIGNGEGNQSFGYGLYFTDNIDVAKFYADLLGKEKGIVYVIKTKTINLFEWYGRLDDDFKNKVKNSLENIGVSELPVKRMLVNNKIETIKKPIEIALDIYPNGKFFYENLALLFGSDKAVSEKLSELGFDGITYPIGQFLKQGDKTHRFGTNYVLFSNDKFDIIDKYTI